MADSSSHLYLGTSGWSYDNWIGDFYPDDIDKSDMLKYYARHFHTVEINASFYQLPFKNMVKGWKNKVPEDFTYAVKGSRKISHYHRLKNVEELLKRFLDRIKPLVEPVGAILWQFPPNFKKEMDRLKNFLKLLPDEYSYAFEFRHESWLNEEVYELLNKHGSALVWQSSADIPNECTATTDFIYIRFHGLEGSYGYSYTPDDLKSWGELIRQHLDEGRDAWVYFNNTGGNAPECARMMREMLGVEV